MTFRDLAGAAIVIPYWLATVLFHLEVSLWLVRRRNAQWLGDFRYADFLPHAAAVLGLAVLARQVGRAMHGSHRIATLAGWALWLAAAIAVDRLLVFSFPEYLHYPQYALLAALTARVVDPDRTRLAVGPVLLAVTLLGIADEALQYAWITISYSNYLDFNDFLLNQLGGLAGMLLYYGFAPRSTVGLRSANPTYQNPVSNPAVGRLSPKGVSRRPSPGTIAPCRRDLRCALTGFTALGLALLVFIAALNAVGTGETLPVIEREPSYGQWIPGPRSGRYYVLPPAPGTLLLTALGALAAAAPTALRKRP